MDANWLKPPTKLQLFGTPIVKREDWVTEKIAASQSTSGDIPESGLDLLNQRDDSAVQAVGFTSCLD